jgi:hypothetical protein
MRTEQDSPRRRNPAARHPWSVEGHVYDASRINPNDSRTNPMRLHRLVNQSVTGMVDGFSEILHPRANVVGGGMTNEVFAHSSTRNRTDPVAGEGSRTNERGVADTTGRFVIKPTGGGGCGKVTV